MLTSETSFIGWRNGTADTFRKAPFGRSASSFIWATCPRSAAALTWLNEFKHGDKDDGADIIGQIATEMGISATDVMQTISEALDRPEGSIMLEMEREVINAAARKSVLSVLDLLQYLKSVLSKGADRDADALQADSDRAAADVEVGIRGNDVDFVANV